MATTTFSTCGTVDGQERSHEPTRRGFLRWVGSVAAAGALAAVGANSLREPADARRHGKKRRQRPTDRQRSVMTRAIENSVLAPDEAEGDQAFAGFRCHWQYVCYPNGV
jgi:hypothetical protein